MSSHSQWSSPRDQEVLGELLHSLSQPLTTLRCSLELSMDDMAESRQQTVTAALEQTETVIGMIQLMREYLDAEQATAEIPAIQLMPVLRSAVEDLSSVAALHKVRMCVAGTCTIAMRVAERRLRMALEYLMTAMIERQPAGSEIVLLLGKGPAGAVLRARGQRGFGPRETVQDVKKVGNSLPKRDPMRSTIWRVRLAIAARVLEAAGATLAFDDGAPGFVVRIPRPDTP